ncbi:hypothetical protein MHM582_3368 [Microbacterium sp. HM58-2]|nr:hypothetical protein MHM582_3368 [Microbacterium sp. HM58-2]
MTEPPLGREDDLDDHAYQVREVYAQYGLSSYLGQVMEKGVVNLLSLHANVESPSPTQQSFDVYFNKFAGYTLGRLILAVEKAFPAEVETIAALRRALPIRNSLAHDFFWDRATQFMSFSGREAMLSEILSMHEPFQAADALVSALVRRVAEAGGITPAQFDANLAEALDELKQQSPHD